MSTYTDNKNIFMQDSKALCNLWSGVMEWSLGVESWSGAIEWHFGVAFWSRMKLDTLSFRYIPDTIN